MSESKELELWLACTEGNLDLVKQLSFDASVDINWQDSEFHRTPFFRACGHGRLSVVNFLLEHPRIEVNKPNINDGTPFFLACQQGHDDVVASLLRDGRVDICKANIKLSSPFFKACQNGHEKVVAQLLADQRVDVNQPEIDNCTPLWFAAEFGHLQVVQLLLVSGREVDTTVKSVAGTAGWNNKTAIEIAQFQEMLLQDDDESEEEYHKRLANGPLIVSLLESFDADPNATRQQLRTLPHLRDPFIGDVFALVVFLSDGLLQIRTGEAETHRFFHIAAKLPMELQMLLCNRVLESVKDFVLLKYSEPAFWRLGNLLSRKD